MIMRESNFTEDLPSGGGFASLGARGRRTDGRILGGAQAEQDDANGFAEEAIDGLPVFELNFVAE